MRAIRSAGTTPEMIVRKLVHGAGYRYRLHGTKLPGKPDLVFGPRRKVIFVHGCYWHQHGCKDSHIPKSNLIYWLPKLERNRQRDKSNLKLLEDGGWASLVIWECETQNLTELKRKICRYLGSR